MASPYDSEKASRITRIAGIDEILQGPPSRSLEISGELSDTPIGVPQDDDELPLDEGHGGVEQRADTADVSTQEITTGETPEPTDLPSTSPGDPPDDPPRAPLHPPGLHLPNVLAPARVKEETSETSQPGASTQPRAPEETSEPSRPGASTQPRAPEETSDRGEDPHEGETPAPTEDADAADRGASDNPAAPDHGAVKRTHSEAEDDEKSDEFVVDVEGLEPKGASGDIRQSWLNVALADRAQRRSDALHLSPGAVIPSTRYRIIRWIGDGGMGVVYEAENMDIGRRFAVKLLRQEVCTIPRATQLFRDEARAAARIGSANIIEIFDFAELPDGRLLYAMELLDGRPLAQEIIDAPLSVPRVIAILRQVCKGLAAAHAVHIVHRDIKPDNIFLGESQGRPDAVKLLDFGIAVFMVGATVTDASVTGTPHYLAPEIITGKPYDARVDMYAVGCTAFEMLTGEAPFEGTLKEILDAQVHREPPTMASVRGDSAVPSEIEAVIRRCISKDPADRYADMDDLEAALCEAQVAAKVETFWDDLPLPNIDVERRDWLLRRMPDPAPDRLVQPSRRRPAIIALAVAAVLIIGALLLSPSLFGGAEDAADPELVALEDEARDLAAQVLFVYPPADAPDARTAYQVILDLEGIKGRRRPSALKLSRALRREFGGTLAAFGEQLWDRPEGREFAIDVYAQALIFDPDIEPAASRAHLTPGQLARLAGRAENKEFSEGELLATEPLVVLAETGDLKTDSPALVRARERLAEQAHDRDTRLAQLTRAPPPEPSPLLEIPKRGTLAGPEAPLPKTETSTPEDRSTATGDTEGETRGGEATESDDETEGSETSGTGESSAPEPAPRKRDPIAAAALVDEARAAARRGADREAERLFERALAQDSRCAEALAGLTEVHFNRGTYSRAFTYGKKAVRLAKADADLRVLVGDAAFKVFRYDEARIHYERAEELGHPQAGKRLAKVTAKLGE